MAGGTGVVAGTAATPPGFDAHAFVHCMDEAGPPKGEPARYVQLESTREVEIWWTEGVWASIETRILREVVGKDREQLWALLDAAKASGADGEVVLEFTWAAGRLDAVWTLAVVAGASALGVR